MLQHLTRQFDDDGSRSWFAPDDPMPCWNASVYVAESFFVSAQSVSCVEPPPVLPFAPTIESRVVALLSSTTGASVLSGVLDGGLPRKTIWIGSVAGRSGVTITR